MTKADPLNLIANPRNLQSAAAATRKQRARERRLSTALLGKEIIIRPEHRSNGGKARKQAVALEMSERDTTLASESTERRSGPLNASQSAIADLCHALGYPHAAIQTPTGRVHRLVTSEDREEDAVVAAVDKKVRHGFEGRYRELDGVVERQCIKCERWLPFNAEHWQRHTTRGVAWWDSRCKPCLLARRREIWRAKHAKRIK